MATKESNTFCGSAEHSIDRRTFLGSAMQGGATLGAGAWGLNALRQPAIAEALKRQEKRVILLWLAGGASQLETWDPKPGRPTGGPYRAIQTTVPGLQISELMPKMAGRLKDTAIIRSLNTKDGSHGTGARLMHLGRRDEPNLKYPDLGAVLARELGRNWIRVNAVAPSAVLTEGTSEYMGEKRDKALEVIAKNQSLQANLETDDLVGTIIFLASDASKFITGQTIMVDGGTTFL